MDNLRKLAKDDEIIDIQVTCDRTWSGHGHQAIYGVVVIAAWAMGQVIHPDVLSKYCAECHAKRGVDTSSEDFLDWYEEHQAQCQVNHFGSRMQWWQMEHCLCGSNLLRNISSITLQ